MNYCSKLIISLFLLLTITFTGIAKSATAMTLNQPTTHLGCVFLCEEHQEEHHDNTYDKGNGYLWAFIAGIFAGMAAAFTFVESFSHTSIIK